jgi:dephospho-CoA kinase
MPRRKKIIAVTGGICSGKSTVAKLLEKQGAKVINADKVAHQLLQDNQEIKTAIKRQISPDAVKNSRVDKKKLASIVFNDPEKLKKLNSILHPQILNISENLIEKYQNEPKIKAIVLDFPLLIEVSWHKKCDNIIFVQTEDKKRYQRAAQKCGFSKNDVKKRENFQISLDKKKAIADYILRNNSDLSVLAGQVAKIFSKILQE